MLEEIRLLLNFESDNAKASADRSLTGQPELRDRLRSAQSATVQTARVALRCNMHAFPSVQEVDRYITERLLIAGSQQPNVFTPGAVDFIFQCSRGHPAKYQQHLRQRDALPRIPPARSDQPADHPGSRRQPRSCCRETMRMLAAEALLDAPASHVLRSDATEEIADGQAPPRGDQAACLHTVIFELPTQSRANGNGNGSEAIRRPLKRALERSLSNATRTVTQTAGTSRQTPSQTVTRTATETATQPATAWFRGRGRLAGDRGVCRSSFNGF
mgnify:CR=1 FL=1